MIALSPHPGSVRSHWARSMGFLLPHPTSRFSIWRDHSDTDDHIELHVPLCPTPRRSHDGKQHAVVGAPACFVLVWINSFVCSFVRSESARQIPCWLIMSRGNLKVFFFIFLSSYLLGLEVRCILMVSWRMVCFWCTHNLPPSRSSRNRLWTSLAWGDRLGVLNVNTYEVRRFPILVVCIH